MELRRAALKCVWDWFEDRVTPRGYITVDNVVARIPILLVYAICTYGFCVFVLMVLGIMPYVCDAFAIFNVMCMITAISVAFVSLVIICYCAVEDLYQKVKYKKIMSCELEESDK